VRKRAQPAAHLFVFANNFEGVIIDLFPGRVQVVRDVGRRECLLHDVYACDMEAGDSTIWRRKALVSKSA
jgi:ATP-dependent helicase YprA (DUF1998 family)